jgi:hypothetical protein
MHRVKGLVPSFRTALTGPKMIVKKPQDNRMKVNGIKSGMIAKKRASNLEPCGIGNALKKTEGQT